MILKLIYIVFFVFLTISVKVNSQTYVPLPDSNAVWNEIHLPPMFSGDSSYYYRNILKNNDTIVNNKTYHQLFYSLIDTSYAVGNDCVYNGGLRESNKQVFYLPKDSLNEYLLYDFSKNVGDTIKYDYISVNYGFGGFDTLIVNSIDSILINDGTLRKRFSFTDVWGISIYWVNWIEGVGSDMGLLFPIAGLPTNDTDNRLVCLKQNHSGIYFNSHFPGCFPVIDATNENINLNNKIIITPNPVTSSSTITWNKGNNFNQLEIYDAFGRSVQRINTINKTSVTIENKQFNNGIFIVKLLDKNGCCIWEKFINL